MDADTALADLRAALPAYASDAARNLETILAASGAHLTATQHWGCVLAAAAAVRSPAATPRLATEARARLDPTSVDSALAVASVMAGHTVYFRARHHLHGAYDDLRAGLRSAATVTPSAPRLDVELWCAVVAAVHGCEACVREHEAGARSAGATREAVNDALRIAAVTASVAATLEAATLIAD